ncbi:MAG: hypothetical protein PSY14_02175 [bacterium]|nr:hypothetical protein [bacterium]
MKKYVLLTALALVIAAPAYAQTSNETAVKRTMTAVEKAAVEQGFSPTSPGPAAYGNADAGMSAAPAPEFEPAPAAPAAPPVKHKLYSNTDTGVSSDIAPTATGASMSPSLSPDVMPAGAAAASGSRPSLVTTGENGLPKGLVMNGPGTTEYKRKHRAKKKKKAAVEQAAPMEADVASPSLKPEAAPYVAPAEPVMETPPAMPDTTSVPPETAPAPAPMAAPVTPEPAPAELQPSPGPDPLTAPADPFAPQQ